MSPVVQKNYGVGLKKNMRSVAEQRRSVSTNETAWLRQKFYGVGTGTVSYVALAPPFKWAWFVMLVFNSND